MIVSRFLLIQFEHYKKTHFGKFLRQIGQKIIKKGNSIEGNLFQGDRIVPSTRCISSGKTFPKLLQSEFIAPNSTIIGDVVTGKKSSLFFGTILKGDNCTIKIGKKTVIQDNTQILNSSDEHLEISIGDNVAIGVNCFIDGATIKDNVVIGNGASIYKGSVVETGSFLAAGAVVLSNTVIPKNQIWVGNPARYLRDIKPDEQENLAENKAELLELANVLVEETEKTQHELISDAYFYQDKDNLDRQADVENQKQMMSYYIKHNTDEMGLEGMSEGFHDLEGEGLTRSTTQNIFREETLDNKFEHDMRNYPDYFKIYSENYKRYEEINRNAENIAPGEARDVFETNRIKPQSPGAMRAWVSKWDPDFNVTFKQTGSRVESNNH